MQKIVAIAFFLLLAACGGQALDSSTEESFKASLAQINAKLDDEKRVELKSALEALAFREMMQNINDVEVGLESYRKKVHGKTADELISMAQKP